MIKQYPGYSDFWERFTFQRFLTCLRFLGFLDLYDYDQWHQPLHYSLWALPTACWWFFGYFSGILDFMGLDGHHSKQISYSLWHTFTKRRTVAHTHTRRDSGFCVDGEWKWVWVVTLPKRIIWWITGSFFYRTVTRLFKTVTTWSWFWNTNTLRFYFLPKAMYFGYKRYGGSWNIYVREPSPRLSRFLRVGLSIGLNFPPLLSFFWFSQRAFIRFFQGIQVSSFSISSKKKGSSSPFAPFSISHFQLIPDLCSQDFRLGADTL